jgi:hypothetical protein
MSPKPEGLRSAKTKLQRAKRHLAEFEKERDAWTGRWTGRKPYAVVGHRISPTKITLKISVKDAIPDQLSTVLGDAVHNLRSALDHLAWALVEANGNVPDEDTQFPISRDLARFEAVIPRRLAGASDKAIEAIKDLKPYKGGNHVLWAVHELDIIDKHRLIVPVASAHTASEVRFSYHADPAEKNFHWLGPPLKVEHARDVVIEDGQPIADVVVEPDFPIGVYVHCDTTIEMLLGAGSSAARQGVGDFLDRADQEIESIINAFDGKFFTKASVTP